MLWIASGLLLAPQVPEPAFTLDNRALVARDEVVRVSLPLPRGRFRALPRFSVDDRAAPAVELMRWPDGSIALVQLQPRVRVEALKTRRYRVAIDGQPPAPSDVGGDAPSDVGVGGPAAGRWCFGADLPLHTELEDPWGTVYRARLVVDPTAPAAGGVVRATAHIRERRFRSVHENGARAYCGLTALLTTFAGERRAELTLVLDNGALDPSRVLGPVRLRSFTLVIEEPGLRSRPRFIPENHLPPPRLENGTWRQVLLPASDQWYLGDATAKAWRIDLFLDGPEVTQAARDAARVAVEQPLRPIPALDWVRHTCAFGVHGALAPAAGQAAAAVAGLVRDWRLHGDFGPFGSFGDAADATLNGTPRNGPCALHNVVRFGSGVLLWCAEGMALQHCLRPTPGVPVRLPPATAPLRQGLSARTMRLPHGFAPLDYEHFSVDLLFDYYWLSGDLLARAELARMGRGLPRVLGVIPFQTARGEGWCMQSAVAIARATGDGALVAHIDHRFRREVKPALGGAAEPHVLAQPPHLEALDGTEAFDCPWQMSAFVHGAAAMHRQTGDPIYAAAALHAARVMAGPGWLTGHGPKYLLSAADPGRYTMPVGFGPLEGTALMQLGGFVLARGMAREEADKTVFQRRAMALAAPYVEVSRPRAAMNPWFQLWCDAEARRR